MTRSRKIEAEVKESGISELRVVGADLSNHTIEEVMDQYTNEGSDSFCPFINNAKLAKTLINSKGINVLARDAPAALPTNWDPAYSNQKNRSYHWVQIGFSSVQFCKFQRDSVERNDDKCEKHFRKCPVYQENIKKR